MLVNKLMKFIFVMYFIFSSLFLLGGCSKIPNTSKNQTTWGDINPELVNVESQKINTLNALKNK